MPAKKKLMVSQAAKDEDAPNDVPMDEEKATAADLTSASTNKKATKRGVEKSEETVDATKPKKSAKKEEQPTRRGGDRAAKKVAVENLTEGKQVVKKSSGAAKKANKPGKSSAGSRGRQPKSGTAKAELTTDDSAETEKTVGTIAVEHCKS